MYHKLAGAVTGILQHVYSDVATQELSVSQFSRAGYLISVCIGSHTTRGFGLCIFHIHEKSYPRYNCNQAFMKALLPTWDHALLEKKHDVYNYQIIKQLKRKQASCVLRYKIHFFQEVSTFWGLQQNSRCSVLSNSPSCAFLISP